MNTFNNIPNNGFDNIANSLPSWESVISLEQGADSFGLENSQFLFEDYTDWFTGEFYPEDFGSWGIYPEDLGIGGGFYPEDLGSWGCLRSW